LQAVRTAKVSGNSSALSKLRKIVSKYLSFMPLRFRRIVWFRCGKCMHDFRLDKKKPPAGARGFG
jgi:hypothetical protein